MSSTRLPAPMVEKMTAGLPAILYWKDPEWHLEDVDYVNRNRLVLVVYHPATHGGVRIGETEFNHTQQDWKPYARDLIERANRLAP
jgi:hypothetical protein